MADAFDRLTAHLDGPPKVRQSDFARKIGASQGLVSQWKNRLAKPTMRFIPALNAELGTTFEEWAEVKLAHETEPTETQEAS